VLGIIWFLTRESNKLMTNNIEKVALAYLFFIVLSTIFSTNVERSIWGRIDRDEGLLAITVYVLLFIVGERKYHFSNKHVKLFLLSASIVALYGIAQYFGYDPIPRDFIRENWKGRAFSTIGNPNFLGTYLTLALPISAFSYIYSKKTIFLLSSGIIYLSLLCTMTRSAWVGAFVSFVILVLYIRKYKYSYKHLAVIVVLFMVITISMNIYSNDGLFGRFITITKDLGTVISQSSGYEKAGANRIFIWERVIELIKQRPLLGYGLETLDIVFTEAYEHDIMALFKHLIFFDKAHNEYLNIAVSTGIPSLVLYLTFIFSIVIKAFKNVKNNHLIIPLLCSVIGYLIQAFFNISVVSVAYIYWAFLGIMLNFSSESYGANETSHT
jgi:putative inorganic carbon (HCO3(-)) transporter